MKVFALVGESGSGKSYKAIMVAKDKKIEYILDDGLLIKGARVIAGKSAKREQSIISAVKRALFMEESHREQVINAINNNNPDRILILGTSDRMVEKIAKILNLGEIQEKIYINQISNEDEISKAKNSRMMEGKHVIPVPTFEIKKDFSGYFIDPLKIFRRKDENTNEHIYEKTVVRPTFSYLGRYTISNGVLKDLTKVGGYKIEGINKISNIYIKSNVNGIHINIDVILDKIVIIPDLVQKLQRSIISEIDYMTSLNILSVNVTIKKIIKT
ncbi:hypothetical protein GOQ27_06395 [Clostridium sp. D2Q-11]|uniref:Asp23/Gls24 family envelope stress response protein n=1 Tax=Anaeromonas frigoriresistens TaxID=2683708 RepID=A0A942URY9_9FIRM|nr:hypothetical protein [Anaeromonas frigoriresistens]MBS4538083.1 hypothetical protein [Anaeromonas frigoriresistens]